MGHEAATRAPFIQLYSHPPHTAVQPTQIRTSERLLRPPQGVNTPPKDYTIQPSPHSDSRAHGQPCSRRLQVNHGGFAGGRLEDPADQLRATLRDQERRASDDERFDGGATEDVGRDEVAAGSERRGLKRTEAVMAQVFE